MSFSETYHAEVLQSRRDRSRRAMFWARILGLVLVLTIGAILRSEPALRSALADVGMTAIMRVTGNGASQQAATQAAPTTSALPVSRVKVNRFGAAQPAPPQDMQRTADNLGATLSERAAGQD